MSTEKISIIIPALNEAANLPTLLRSLKNEPDIEIIVVDGGSSDETAVIAQAAGCRVISSPPGRGYQMNIGAAEAAGSVLLFLHADSTLPQAWALDIRKAMERKLATWGAFRLQLNENTWYYRVIERGANLRTRLFQLPYGDQGIFVRTSTFRGLGGFSQRGIMEDAYLCRDLGSRGAMTLLPTVITTSVRKWQRFGPVKTTTAHLLMMLAFMLRLPPQFQKDLYSRLFKTRV